MAFETAVAANLLCTLKPGSLETFDFSDPSSLSDVARAEQMKLLVDAMQNGEVEVLLIGRANPLFHLPPSWQIEKALRSVPMKVSLSSFPDETGEFAHLILPTHTFLESWGDYSPRRSVTGCLQPVMGPIFDTRNLGDVLLSTGRKIKQESFPEKDFYEMLRNAWSKRGEKEAGTVFSGGFLAGRPSERRRLERVTGRKSNPCQFFE